MRSSYFDVRSEQPDDAAIIDDILSKTFGPDRVTKSSYRLREGSNEVEDLAFVAELDGRMVGTIKFWPIVVGGKKEALLLGPLAVLPLMQGFGVGLLLIEHGVAAAQKAGHDLVILVGDEPYYARAGFKRVEGKVLMPGPFKPERLLCRELASGSADSLDGLILPPHRT